MKRYFRYVVPIFIPTMILILTLAYFINGRIVKSSLQDLTEHQYDLNQREAQHLYEYLYPVLLDNYFLAQQANSQSSDYNEVIETLRDEFFIFSNASKYDQIRVIDTLGFEMLRVDYTENGAKIIPSDSLQNKKHRDYFQIARNLSIGQIYFSRIDLNKEFRKLEVPYQPVIRLISPIVEANDNILGYLVINCDAQRILEPVDSEENSSFLLNDRGYWLNDNRLSPAFAFEFDSLTNQNLDGFDSDAWQSMQSQDSGALVTNNGLFVWQKISFHPLIDRFNEAKGIHLSTLKPSQLYLVKYINSQNLNSVQTKHYPLLILCSVSAILLIFSIWVSISISNVKKKDLELQKKVKELSHNSKVLTLKNTQLESFIRIASHDLREPLASIKSVAKSLEEYQTKPTDKFYVRYLDFIVACTDRMDRLTKGVLDYAVTGRSSKLEKIDLKVIIDNIKDDLSHSFNTTNTKITINELPTITCYKMEIKQVFQNLISNAIKYAKDNTPPEITISYKENSTHHLFHIKDNGIGISETDSKKVFQMFKRLETKKSEDGLGIGLAISRKIIELHLGEIWIESNKDSGTTFSFTISKNLYNDH
ncbi:MAG: hypothetical protein CMP48_03540 [Rickettsiales bacterium]|nr:hypothetical protein [Rickettsiales bacterium]